MFSRNIKSLVSDSALYGLGIFLMKGISLIMLPVYTYYLSPSEYGRLEVLVVFANLVSIFLSFGLIEALYRFVGLADDMESKKRHAAECLLLAAIVAAVSYAFFHFYSDAIAQFLPGKITANEVYLLGASLALGGLINVPLAWIRITARARLFFKVTIAKVIIQVTLSYYWLVTGWGISSILASGAVSALVVALYLSAMQLKETGIHFSSKNVVSIANYGWPILIGGVATFALSGMDRWLLAKHFGEQDIAVYAIAIKFALVPTLLIQPFTLWWYPKRFSVLKEENGLSANAKFAMLGATICALICGLLGLVGPTAIRWLTPIEYHQAANILPWLLLCTLLKLVSELLNLGCYIDKDSHTQMHINITASIAGAVMLLILIPTFHIDGSIAALIVAYSIRMSLFYFYSQRRLYLPYKFGFLFSAVSGAVIATYVGQIIEVTAWFGLL